MIAEINHRWPLQLPLISHRAWLWPSSHLPLRNRIALCSWFVHFFARKCHQISGIREGVRPWLLGANEARPRSDIRKMHHHVLRFIHFIFSAIRKKSVEGGNFLRVRRMPRFFPSRPVRIYELRAHVAVECVHQITLSVRPDIGIRPPRPIGIAILRGHKFPCPQKSLAHRDGRRDPSGILNLRGLPCGTFLRNERNRDHEKKNQQNYSLALHRCSRGISWYLDE